MIISDKHLNRWGLPEQSVISQVDILNCDAIVDLNPEFNPAHAVLINKVNSSLKIGFESKWSHELFNVTFSISMFFNWSDSLSLSVLLYDHSMH